METTLDNGEVALLNEDGWLVTNKRVCRPEGIIRLSDVQRIEILSKKAKNHAIYLSVATILFILGGLAVFRFDVHGLGVVFCACPGLLFSCLAAVANINVISLTAHNRPGTVVLRSNIEVDPGGILWLLWTMTGRTNEVKRNYETHRSKMNSIQEAIGKALAHSPTVSQIG